MIILKKYSIGIIIFLLMMLYAKQSFERVKSIPNEMMLVSNTMPRTDQVINVAKRIQMQENSEPIYYKDVNDDENERKNLLESSSNAVFQKSKTKASSKISTTKKILPKNKVVNSNSTSQNNSSNKVLEDAESVAKFNEALNEKLRIRNSTQPQIDSTSKAEKLKKPTVIVSEVKKENGNRIAKALSQKVSQKGKGLILGGGVLMVLGIVLGLIFDRQAFWVSVAGLAFAIVGFFI